MDDDLALYFGANRERLMQLCASGVWTFCWPGLVFPQAWFLYRKMYGWAALTTAGPLMAERVPYLSWAAWGAPALGAVGLNLYFHAAWSAVAAIRAESSGEEETRARIERGGGVSRFGAAVGALYLFGLFILRLKAGYR